MKNPLLLLAPLALAACATPQPKVAAPASATPVPAVATATPVDCVDLARIREARVVDDQTIDFILSDGRTLRNTLPYRCSGLGFEKAFSYATSLSRLCKVDIITVIRQGGGPSTGASCGLGMFVPQPDKPRS
ncbi:hypothetical protein [Sandaracinobacteroides saxicola]|uniref:Lipoprotein n=1 Tax=Sandaracinobacteroides saxicola TaxID=2759707 RepID=A0A7G5IL73_9SPHN|nr:hypothetical protein [Sandaracinobacteroides saxicola]QMW24115.1 hypothetical protein H3309_06570 [Sandaracinobacteroides saxicola]